jgi:hypothetical protein
MKIHILFLAVVIFYGFSIAEPLSVYIVKNDKNNSSGEFRLRAIEGENLLVTRQGFSAIFKFPYSELDSLSIKDISLIVAPITPEKMFKVAEQIEGKLKDYTFNSEGALTYKDEQSNEILGQKNQTINTATNKSVLRNWFGTLTIIAGVVAGIVTIVDANSETKYSIPATQYSPGSEGSVKNDWTRTHTICISLSIGAIFAGIAELCR